MTANDKERSCFIGLKGGLPGNLFCEAMKKMTNVSLLWSGPRNTCNALSKHLHSLMTLAWFRSNMIKHCTRPAPLKLQLLLQLLIHLLSQKTFSSSRRTVPQSIAKTYAGLLGSASLDIESPCRASGQGSSPVHMCAHATRLGTPRWSMRAERC